LRQSLDKDVEPLIVEQIAKEISWFSGPDIEGYIKRRQKRKQQRAAQT